MHQNQHYYTIKSKHAGKVLDVCQDSEKKGILIIYHGYGGQNQQFQLKDCGGDVQIISKQSNKAISVSEGSELNEAIIKQSEDKGENYQKFRLQEVEPGSDTYIIYTFCGKVLDCFECKTSNGTKVIQYDFNGGDNQKWIIKKV